MRKPPKTMCNWKPRAMSMDPSGSIQTCSTLAGDVGDVADAMEGGEGEGDTCSSQTGHVEKPGWLLMLLCTGWGPPADYINGVISHSSYK